MKCIIQVDESDNCIGHPITIQNFVLTFPDLDISGDVAPTGYAWFTRKDRKSIININLTIKQTVDCTYTKTSDGLGFEDTFTVRDLTQDEINALIDSIKNYPPLHLKSWTLETDTYFWIPPTERPKGRYRWDESTGVWVACVGDELPTPAKWPSEFTPESALSKHPVANTSNTVTANT
jgi:hypothetical protein